VRSKDTVQWASLFASGQNADLHLVHAIYENEESTNRGVLEVRRYLCDEAQKRWKHLATDLDVKATLHVAYGRVGDAVRKPAHDLNADVVIIGRGHLQERLGRLRTSSYDTIRESPCPVISV
jgi:nucleotide-binding universal stress UspA family protein